MLDEHLSIALAILKDDSVPFEFYNLNVHIKWTAFQHMYRSRTECILF